MSAVDIRTVMTDADFFGATFGGPSWAPWRALLAGFYGLTLDADEAATFHHLTSRDAPTDAHSELWLAIGRRAGKSHMAALLAVYEACFRDHKHTLAPGEVATVQVVAADRKQGRVVFRYILGLLRAHPALQRLIARENAESVILTNQVEIEIATCSHRSIRGYTVAAFIADELAFWHSEGATPDAEIIAAARPALGTTGGKLIALSSPYARRGELWRHYQRHYGQASPVLVAQGASRDLNPELPQHVIDDALERDPDAARAEFYGMFRKDIEDFLTREAVEAVTRPQPLEVPRRDGTSYRAFLDVSGGSSDATAVAIGHAEGDSAIVDVVREWRAPHNPESVASEIAELLKDYGVRRATADRYAGAWVPAAFERHGIRVDQAARPKSDLYADLLPAVNAEKAELPPHARLTHQLVSLERRKGRQRDIIDHGPNQHDDLANVAAGLVSELTTRRKVPETPKLGVPSQVSFGEYDSVAERNADFYNEVRSLF